MRLATCFLSLGIACWFLPISITAAEPAPVEGLRVWTNHKNQDITASLVKITRASADQNQNKPARLDVTFKLNTGKKVTFDVGLLSPPHQQELQAWLKTNPYGAALPSPPYSWPTQHNGNNSPEVVYVRYDEERKAHLYHTAHFDFYSDERLSDATISKCAAVFDSIVEAIDAYPMEMDTIPSGDKPRFQAILVSTREKYTEMGGNPNSAGFFSTSKNLTVIPFQSLGIVKKGSNWVFDGEQRSFDTLIHELTHHCTSHWSMMPLWFREGHADYMEAMPYQSGRFLFTNPGSAVAASIRKYKNYTTADQVMPKGVFQMRQLETLFKIDRTQWKADMQNRTTGLSSRNYGSALILTYFLMHEDGAGDGHHLIQWLHKHRAAVASRRTSDVDAVFKMHILRDRTYSQLEEEIITAMGKKGLRLEFAP
jgi:hypothetical protein